jgi:hypothetical protein
MQNSHRDTVVAIDYAIVLHFWASKGSIMLMLALGIVAAVLLTRAAEAQPAFPTISIVAAENFYGDVARQVAGSTATVTSILSNPDQDPHLFEPFGSSQPVIGRDRGLQRGGLRPLDGKTPRRQPIGQPQSHYRGRPCAQEIRG